MKKSGRRRNQLLKDANLVIARKNDEAIQISGPSYPWLSADGISNSFANKSVIAFAHYLVETNVPGGAVPPLVSTLLVDRALRAR